MNYFSLRFYYQSMLDFFRFVRSPQGSLDSLPTIQTKIVVSVFLLCIKFAFSILVASVVGLFYEPQNLTDQSMSQRFSPLLYLAVGGLILPIFEEVLFRLSLIFRPIYLSLSLSCGSYYLLTKFVYGSKLSLIDETFFIRVGAALAVGLISFIILQKNPFKSFLKGFWSKNFSLIYYGSAIVFAWLHVLNFEPSLTNLLLTPVLTLPQFFSGLVSGYLRTRFGFIYPLTLHVATNSILIGLSILIA